MTQKPTYEELEQRIRDLEAGHERHYRTMIHSIREDILLIDLDYRITDTNNSTLHTLGLKREDVIGRYCYEISHGFSEPCYEHGEQCGMRLVIDTGKHHNIHHQHISANGEKKHIDILFSPMKDKEGNITHVVETMRDVTDLFKSQEALQRSEKKYRELVENLNEIIFSTTIEGRITYVSPPVEKVLGYTPAELIGKYDADIVHPDDLEWGRRKVIEVIKGRVYPSEYRGRTKKGEYRWFRVSGRPVYEGENIVGFQCVFFDITEQKRAEEEKEKLKAQLAQAQKMESIGNLAGGIAHDFNNILFPIVGLSEILLEDLPQGSSNHENVKEIYRAGLRGGDLVKQILAFSRQSEHKLIPVRIQHVLEEVISLCRSTIPTYIEIYQDIQNDCEMVMADPTQLHQIAMNLITNAYHAVEESGGKISVYLSEKILESGDPDCTYLAPGRYAELTISDTGHGIEPVNLDKVFEPYYTTKEQGKGTGLGLAVVYGIVKEYGGEIKINSKVGKGTTCSVFLPLIEKNSETIPIESPENDTPGTERILLVDDEISIVNLEKQILERFGYHVTACSNSLEALDAFKANPSGFDLFVTDMTMPHMTGSELAKEVLSIRSDMPIIICTGFSERIDRDKAKAIGVKAFLMKPISKSNLSEMVRKVLDEVKDASKIN